MNKNTPKLQSSQTGFQITFTNGITASVQWDSCKIKAEVYAWRDDLGDIIKGWCSAPLMSDWLKRLSEYPES